MIDFLDEVMGANTPVGKSCLKVFYVVDRLRDRAGFSVPKEDQILLESLSYRQTKALFVVGHLLSERTDGIQLKELAGQMAMTISATSILVETMVKKQAFQRTTNPRDRRAVSIRLTPEGVKMLETLTTLRQKQIYRLTEGVPKEDIAAFERVIDHLYNKLN